MKKPPLRNRSGGYRTNLCASGAGLLDDNLECVHVRNRELAEHLSVDLNPTLRETVNQLGVLDIALGTRTADSGDPESSEISLLTSSVTEGVLPRLHDLFVGSTKDVFLTSPIAGCLRDYLFVALVAHKAAFYTCHSSIHLFWIRTGSHLE